MLNFISGMIFMYLLGIGFVVGITEPAEDGNPNAPLKLGMMWPWAALMLLFAMMMDKFDEHE